MSKFKRFWSFFLFLSLCSLKSRSLPLSREKVNFDMYLDALERELKEKESGTSKDVREVNLSADRKTERNFKLIHSSGTDKRFNHADESKKASSPFQHEDSVFQPVPLQKEKAARDFHPPHHEDKASRDFRPPHHDDEAAGDFHPSHHDDEVSRDFRPPHHDDEAAGDSHPSHHDDKASRNFYPPHHDDEAAEDSHPPHHDDEAGKDSHPPHHDDKATRDFHPPHHDDEAAGDSHPSHHDDKASRNFYPSLHDDEAAGDFHPPHHDNKAAGDFHPPHHDDEAAGNFYPSLHDDEALRDFHPPHHDNKAAGDFHPPDHDNKAAGDFHPPHHDNEAARDFHPPHHDDEGINDFQPLLHNSKALSDFHISNKMAKELSSYDHNEKTGDFNVQLQDENLKELNLNNVKEEENNFDVPSNKMEHFLFAYDINDPGTFSKRSSSKTKTKIGHAQQEDTILNVPQIKNDDDKFEVAAVEDAGLPFYLKAAALPFEDDEKGVEIRQSRE